MLLHVQHNVEVTGRAAELADFASAGKANPGSIFNPCRNFGVDGTLAKNAPFALALRARISDDAACSLAGGTGARNAEESLLVADLAASVAGPASRGPLARRRDILHTPRAGAQ
jgi:hypothetical protein